METRTDKKIAVSKSDLEKRKAAEITITETNTKIKNIETKLVAATPAERIRLESELKLLYEQKSVQMRTFEGDIAKPRIKDTVIDTQKTEVQKEIDKFNTLSNETLELKKRIDSIGDEVRVAKDALNNEKDPIKVKKLKSEI